MVSSKKHIKTLLQLSFLVVFLVHFYSFITPNNEKKLEAYKIFLKKFKKQKSPTKIRLKHVQYYGLHVTSSDDYKSSKYLNKNKKKILKKDFDIFIPAISENMHSRLGPKTYSAEILVANKEKFDAVIYSDLYDFSNSRTFFLATFDKQGNPIATETIGAVNPEKRFDIKITSKLKFVIKTMELLEDKMIFKANTTYIFNINGNGNILKDEAV